MFKAPRLSTLAYLALAGTCLPLAAAQPPATPAPAAPAEAAPQGPKDSELLRDFIHYVRIARYDLAASNGQALLDRMEPPFGKAEAGKGLKLADFVKLVDDTGELTRFEETAVRAQRVGELEAIASRLLRAYETGKLEQARSAQEITRSIGLLTGNARQRAVGRERLAAAGEYAMIQLLEALQRKSEPVLQAEVRQLMIDMRQQALIPLATALPGLSPELQEVVVNILGQIPYRTSLPFIYELHGSTKSDRVRAACERAARQIDGAFNPGLTAASLFEMLGDAYYEEADSLTPFPREGMQLLWAYDPATGLTATAIQTVVFHEAMAMRMAERALRLDARSGRALSLWLAANFSRELNQPKDYQNPAYGSERRDAMYYAVAAGPQASQAVLARAIDRRDTPLARRAIAAIERTAGPVAMTSGDMMRRPLLEALRYPSRRVQYEAALAVATAQPTQSFEGSERVVPILGSAIRDAGMKYAVVVTDRAEVGTDLATRLQGMGYTVMPPASTLDANERAIAEAPGIDLIVMDLPAGPTARSIEQARSRSRTAVAPIVAVLSLQGEQELNALRRDEMTRFIRAGYDPAQMNQAIEQLVVKVAGGPITADEAADYQSRSLAALRELALASNSVLQVIDAAPAMVAAMSPAKGAVKAKIADVLSFVGDPRAQVAIVDAALSAQGDEMIELLRIAAQSAKRYGNMLEERQVKRLLGMTSTGSDAQATAVAALIGALNLPNQELVPLIVGK